MKEDPATLATIAMENSLECMLFAQDGDPTKRRPTATMVDPLAAKEFDLPIYPLVTALNGNYAAADIEFTLRSKEKKIPGIIAKLNEANMPKISPNKKPIKWKGLAYEVPLVLRQPAVKNQDTLFQAIEAHRKVRGRNTGRKSLYSKGYYFGYMDNPTARMAHLVLDLEYLARETSLGRFLEIQNVDGIFNENVLNSLVINGWVVVIRNGHIFDTLTLREKQERIPPGIYKRIIGCINPFLVFNVIDQQNPSIVKNSNTGYMEVNLRSVTDRFADFVEENKTLRVNFCYAYFRDEFKDWTKYLYPTSHAHAGFVIFCSQPREENKFDLYEYFKRVLTANIYKTAYVYHRMPFWGKDVYGFDISFKLTMKTKVKMGAWSKSDYTSTVIEDKIKKIEVDYAYLAKVNPVAASALKVVNNDKSLTENDVKFVVDIGKEKDNEDDVNDRHDESFLSNTTATLHDTVPPANTFAFQGSYDDEEPLENQ
jgi:hypothetical protein